MPAKITDEGRIDRFLDVATKDQLIRLRSDVCAALRWRFQDSAQPAQAKRGRKVTAQARLPIGGDGERQEPR